MAFLYLDISKGNKKPKVPILNDKTGGTGVVGNNEAVCRAVPSPPKVIAKSILEDNSFSLFMLVVYKFLIPDNSFLILSSTMIFLLS